jgi:hypothetical protein
LTTSQASQGAYALVLVGDGLEVLEDGLAHARVAAEGLGAEVVLEVVLLGPPAEDLVVGHHDRHERPEGQTRHEDLLHEVALQVQVLQVLVAVAYPTFHIPHTILMMTSATFAAFRCVVLVKGGADVGGGGCVGGAYKTIWPLTGWRMPCSWPSTVRVPLGFHCPMSLVVSHPSASILASVSLESP